MPLIKVYIKGIKSKEKLALKLKTLINLIIKLAIPETLISALRLLIYYILLNIKANKIIKVIKIN
jgi:hypothetical protein